MISFLLYLFESGLCLTILVLVYFFFFKNETYFRFNRIYLVSIMFLSLLIPFFHVNLNVADTHRYEFALKRIGEFKTYYEKLIAMSDPEYLENTNKSKIARFEDYETGGASGMQTEQKIDNNILTDENSETIKAKHANISLATLLFIIYLTGVIFFLFRIMLLFQWIFKTIKSNKLKIQHGVKIIELDKKLPPFSFLGYVFLSKDLISKNKQEQILMHEKVHIKQFHSVDLLIAHFITIVQWFNPFVWLLQKAIKNNHEYLADSQVVNKGYNLLNYQELLLNQFISIPSVQLVNNFNLISIKNRIRMMNKIKSGFAAKLKALLIIPAALFTFILFANLTLNGPGNVLTNLSFLETQKNMSQLKGLWNNTSNNTYGKQVLFEDHKFSVIDKNIDLKEYPYQLQENQVILNAPGNEKIKLNYEITNSTLKIWWNQDEYSLYEKSKFSNSLDDYLSNIPETINLPTIENYGILQRQELCIDVAMVGNKIYVNNKPTDYSQLKDALLKEKSKINHLNTHLITISLYADKDLSMEYMHNLNQTLREIGLLKVAHMGKVTDNKVSKLQSSYIGMPKRLPPLDGIEIIPSEDLADKGIAFFEMDATNPENSPGILKPKFEELLKNSEKYIASLYYDKSTILNTYIGYQDMARTVVFGLRNQYAQEKFNLTFDELSSVQQKSIRKIYPLIISEAESDLSED